MKFHSLSLSQFRQYRETETILFSNKDSDPRVTLIRGSNGYGKTGIFRAIMFCLYGDLALDQDGLNTNDAKKGLVLVNEKLLEEQAGKSIEASVTLEFSHKGSLYTLQRKIKAILDPETRQITQEPADVSLQETESTGTTTPSIRDSIEIKEKINQLLSSKVRDFFLFDGERMEKLTRYGEEQRKEVQRGIRALLQIDTIHEAINGLKKQEKFLTKKVRDNSSGELDVIVEEKERLESKLRITQENIASKKNEKDKNQSLINEIENKLQDNEGIKELNFRRKNLQESLNKYEDEKMENIERLRELLGKGGLYLALPAIAKISEHLETKLQNGDLTSGITPTMLAQLLKASHCICGTHLKEGSNERKTLEDLKSYEPPLHEKAAHSFLPKIVRLNAEAETLHQEFEEKKLTYSALKDNFSTMEKELERLDEELIDRPDTAVLGEELDELKQIRESLTEQLQREKLNLEKITDELELAETRFKDLSAREERAQKYVKQRTAIQKASQTLIEIKGKYESQIREKLASTATSYFKRLIDDEAKRSLAGIDINEKFQLDVLNHAGRGMLSQISAGQRQIVSLSYICALLEISNFEVPLLMDTPFGRLSGAPRDACLQVIPTITPQWIMLVTDTEFQQDEASALRKSGAWGKLYELKSKGDRYTVINEADISTWVPRRQNIGSGV